MNNTVEIVKDIILNNVDDLPIKETVIKDKIVLGKKKRIYKSVTSILIPKHEIEISHITNEHYKGYFLLEKKTGTVDTYFLKYKGELIPLNENDFYMLDEIWYDNTNSKRTKQQQKETMNIVINTMGA